jgi:hypothetical protein
VERKRTNGSVKVGDIVALDGVDGARRVGVDGAESTGDYSRSGIAIVSTGLYRVGLLRQDRSFLLRRLLALPFAISPPFFLLPFPPFHSLDSPVLPPS